MGAKRSKSLLLNTTATSFDNLALIVHNLWVEILKVYDISLQRYNNYKITDAVSFFVNLVFQVLCPIPGVTL